MRPTPNFRTAMPTPQSRNGVWKTAVSKPSKPPRQTLIAARKIHSAPVAKNSRPVETTRKVQQNLDSFFHRTEAPNQSQKRKKSARKRKSPEKGSRGSAPEVVDLSPLDDEELSPQEPTVRTPKTPKTPRRSSLSPSNVLLKTPDVPLLGATATPPSGSFKNKRSPETPSSDDVLSPSILQPVRRRPPRTPRSPVKQLSSRGSPRSDSWVPGGGETLEDFRRAFDIFNNEDSVDFYFCSDEDRRNDYE